MPPKDCRHWSTTCWISPRLKPARPWFEIGTFDVHNLLESLEGTIRPMIGRAAVSLVFVEPKGIPALISDEGKIAQILRNFLTNAVKFTERGEIRVAAELGPDDAVTFSVKDTGIGIAVADLPRIFEDYGQVDNRLQSRNKGIGLGLPLTRKLAQLLGGSVSVWSELGTGSTFFAVIPRRLSSDDRRRLTAGLGCRRLLTLRFRSDNPEQGD